MSSMMKNLVILHLVVGLGMPFQVFAGKTDIIPGELFPGRYIGTPIIKKNGKEYIQFQECHVLEEEKVAQAECRAIVEIPSDILYYYLRCEGDFLESELKLGEFGRDLSIASAIGAFTVMSLTMKGPLVGTFYGGFAVLWASNYINMKFRDRVITLKGKKDYHSFNMKEEHLTRNVDYTASAEMDELIKRIEGLYNEISTRAANPVDNYFCRKFSEIGTARVRSKMKRYGQNGPKTRVKLEGQKFYQLTGRKKDAPSAQELSGSGDLKAKGAQ